VHELEGLAGFGEAGRGVVARVASLEEERGAYVGKDAWRVVESQSLLAFHATQELAEEIRGLRQV